MFSQAPSSHQRKWIEKEAGSVSRIKVTESTASSFSLRRSNESFVRWLLVKGGATSQEFRLFVRVPDCQPLFETGVNSAFWLRKIVQQRSQRLKIELATVKGVRDCLLLIPDLNTLLLGFTFALPRSIYLLVGRKELTAGGSY